MANCCETNTNGGSLCGAEEKRVDVLFWLSLTATAFLFALNFWMPQQLESYHFLTTMSQTVMEMLHSIWWGVLIGMFFVGLLSKVPKRFIMALFGEGGTIRGLLRATAAGVLLDMCSHGILMIGAKLYERGASAGQVIAFLLASPWNSLSLTLILIGLIGLPLTALFIVLSMLIALVTGYLFDKFVGAGVLPKNPHREEHPQNFKFWIEAKTALKTTDFSYALFKNMAQSALKDSRMVLRWLLFGVVLASVLRAVMSPELFQDFFGPTLFGLMMTMVLTTLVEVCSEGSAPIAADIVTRANAPGNGFAFLMAGVATDYTEIMVIKDMSKSWRLALFLPLISVPQILLISWLINVSF